MGTECWQEQEVQNRFYELADAPSAAHEAHLEELQPIDPEWTEPVRALPRASARADDVLQDLERWTASAQHPAETTTFHPGYHVEAYEIVEKSTRGDGHRI